MKSLIASMCAALILAGPAWAGNSDDPVSGKWIGSYSAEDVGVTLEDFRVHLVMNKQKINGTIGQGPDGFRLVEAEYDADSGMLTGTAETKGRSGDRVSVRMQATIDGDQMTGSFATADGAEGVFEGTRE